MQSLLEKEREALRKEKQLTARLRKEDTTTEHAKTPGQSSKLLTQNPEKVDYFHDSLMKIEPKAKIKQAEAPLLNRFEEMPGLYERLNDTEAIALTAAAVADAAASILVLENDTIDRDQVLVRQQQMLWSKQTPYQQFLLNESKARDNLSESKAFAKEDFAQKDLVSKGKDDEWTSLWFKNLSTIENVMSF